MYREHAAEDRSLLVVAFGGTVFALERVTGKVKWKFLVDQSGETDVEIHVAGGVVIAASSQRIVFVEYATGQEIRGGKLPGKQHGRPTMILDEENVYVGRNGEVVCFGLGGKAKWNQTFDGKGAGKSVALGFPGQSRQSDS